MAGAFFILSPRHSELMAQVRGWIARNRIRSWNPGGAS